MSNSQEEQKSNVGESPDRECVFLLTIQTGE